MYYLLVFFIVISFIYYKYHDILTNIIEKKTYNISTGVENTPYYVFGEILMKLINKPSSDFTLRNNNNYINKFEELENNNTQFTICQEDQFLDAYLGQGTYNTPHKNLRFISGLYFEYIHFIMNVNSRVNNIMDLQDPNRNYIIGLDHINSGSYNNFMTIINFLGINIKETNDSFNNPYESNTVFYYTTNNLNDLMNLFYEDKIDGIFLIRATNDIYIKNLIQQKDIKFIELEKNNFNDIVNKMKNFYWKKLNTTYYYTDLFESKIVSTIAFRSVLITNNTIETSVVHDLLKTIFMNIGQFLIAITNISDNLDRQYIGGTIENLPNDFEPVEMAYIHKLIPMHIGAIKYYRSINLITNDEKAKYDLKYYADKVKDYYWKYQY